MRADPVVEGVVVAGVGDVEAIIVRTSALSNISAGGRGVGLTGYGKVG